MVDAPWNNSYQPSYTTQVKPKVGLAVVCRCKDNNVQCLLQRRGPNSSSPNKWSFPGGRLIHPGDLEEDGATGTLRELREECGGGTPPDLPDLIHIECCKSGKVRGDVTLVYTCRCVQCTCARVCLHVHVCGQ